MFKSKIICAPMNGVSDLKLALACNEAGILPSLIPYSYLNFKQFFLELAEYKKVGGDILVAMRLDEIVDDRLIEKLLLSGITHIELLEYNALTLTASNVIKINYLRNNGIKILLKVLTHTEIEPFKNIIDAVTVKGSAGAGRSLTNIDLIEEIKTISLLYPNIGIIASGGVKNSDDIRQMISAGACAVSIGTLFAMSKEYSIPIETKNKLLASSSTDIRRLSKGAGQRAIVFNESTGNDDFNNTKGLKDGIHTGTAGHIFAGDAIGIINGILPIQEIVDRLLS